MATTIWSGLVSGIIRYDLTYDAWRPDPYGDEVRINFHLRTYLQSGKFFGFQIRWDAMWCMGTNRVSRLIKDNSPNKFDFWTDSGEFSVWTGESQVWGVRLIMTSPNNSPSGWYDTGNDISIGVPAKLVNTPATPPTDGAIYSTNNTSGVHRGTIKDISSCQVWWDWWGQTSGQPNSNVIKEYAVDMNTVNNSANASSISGVTYPYKANTKVSLSTIISNFNVKAGGTVYCWVNTLTNGGSWLGRQYLGAIQIIENEAPDINIESNVQKVDVDENITLSWTDLSDTDYYFSNYCIQVSKYDSTTNTWSSYVNINSLYSSYPSTFAKTVTSTTVVLNKLYSSFKANDRFSFKVGVISDGKTFISDKSVGIYLNMRSTKKIVYKENTQWNNISMNNIKYKDASTFKTNIKIKNK